MTHSVFARTLLLLAALMAASTLIGCSRSSDVQDDEEIAVERLQTQARNALRSARWMDAQRHYQNLVTRYPFGEHAEDSLLELAYAQFRANEHDRAISTSERFIRTYPLSENLPYAYYLKGAIRAHQGRSVTGRLFGFDPANNDQTYLRRAFRDFREVVDRFPDTQYAEDARQRMVHLRNILARHEVMVAKYYLDREAWVAASRRAAEVLEEFPRTPSVADALAIQVIAYEELGQDELAERNRQVLNSNFPDYNMREMRTASGTGGFLARIWPF